MGTDRTYRFHGWETADVAPVVALPHVRDPRGLYDALLHAWCADTCAPRLRYRWTPDNPTLGQCSVTAFLAQDVFGGEVRGIPRPGGTFHCFNVAGGRLFDLTSEQFGGEALDYARAVPQRREDHFAHEEKRLRYELLWRRLRTWLGAMA